MDRKLAALKKLQEIVARLRAPGGCPWDRKQTLKDMARYLLEEAGEVTDAIDEGEGRPSAAVCEELGDVLMNVFLAAEIASEEGGFTLAEVAEDIAAKLVRRHPHVFGNASAISVEEVLSRWNDIKAAEKKGLAQESPSRLDGVPRSLPPLVRAYELGLKAAKAGFDWPHAEGALEKVLEELSEVKALLQEADHARLEEELGDVLFAVASLCRKLDVRPDNALRRTLKKFCERFRKMEERLPTFEKATLEELESLWQASKNSPG